MHLWYTLKSVQDQPGIENEYLNEDAL